MKNVLFATTALVALAGAASAQSISFSGDVTAGYNDNHFGGLFMNGSVGATGSVDLGDNMTATVSLDGLLYSSSNGLGVHASQKVSGEFVYTASAYTASLRLGDMNDKGASEYFYKDRSGMKLDVENQDNHNSARALVQFGNYGVAVGCGTAALPIATTDTLSTCNGINVGLGATFGSVKLGVGYDDAAAGRPRTAVSVDTKVASIDLGLSYITGGPANSIGLEASKTFGAAKVKAYFAKNSSAPDAYGLSVDYTAGALTLGAYYDNILAANSYGVDVTYAVSDALKVKAGYLSGKATVYTAAQAQNFGTKSYTAGSYYQVGVEYAVNSAVSATLSYSNADGFGDAGYNQGISALITASF